ncbi:MAG: acyl-CoA synthetase, partial [Rhodospirillales bacterium]|nr:acyl-CoA synthetase [Rhodospirillales bacterium]
FAFDEDGWWYTPDRADDMLKISDQWVSPTEVEEVAMTVPGILEAAAVGAPNKDGLIRLTLFAVADPAEPLEALEQRVVETLRQNLAIYKCPRHVRFIEAMPRTPTGKMQRLKLRERLVAEASS